ncbi:oxygen-independent coproporphyrinogen III oxidase [Oricola cellulosilytica]|uniref:Coproporphyrinogen-III oxidase n=1 Tax=Oricola cellulosilytica TaxID=1429082 RepID=A0A4R0PDW2_9HYPH|nr:oxygen-independent coproporphyrinogen III oxidase [Oricola cellulosilytica]TCD14943.1 oxygen-independent coproporphyrinogen III oxidase [Oricola cellulosilytica]
MTLNIDAILSNQRAIPRYTSYPTAPHFADQAGLAIAHERLATLPENGPVSLYLHVPYCDRLCWFCGCHTKHTLKYEPVQRYVEALVAEIALARERAGKRLRAGQVHFGGGSPSMLRLPEFDRLSTALRTSFLIDEKTEISVEIDPSDVTPETLDGLRLLGVTRASIGVQDFDEAVQKAINRPQTYGQTRDVVAELRSTGVDSLNIDALYGLPLQTLERLETTIGKVLSLGPDRIALFGYAHVPWLKKHQTMIREQDLPGTRARFDHARRAAELISAAGYDRIGIDHFAKPDDGLAKAARAGRLHRNFQGYTADPCRTLVGLGASSISFYGNAYVQNIVPTSQYETAVHAGTLPAMRGVRLTLDDQIRAFMIERLMCDFALSFSHIERRFGSAARSYIAEARLACANDRFGLSEVTGHGVTIPDEARPFARIVASRFDAYLSESWVRYSKAV